MCAVLCCTLLYCTALIMEHWHSCVWCLFVANQRRDAQPTPLLQHPPSPQSPVHSSPPPASSNFHKVLCMLSPALQLSTDSSSRHLKAHSRYGVQGSFPTVRFHPQNSAPPPPPDSQLTVPQIPLIAPFAPSPPALAPLTRQIPILHTPQSAVVNTHNPFGLCTQDGNAYSGSHAATGPHASAQCGRQPAGGACSGGLHSAQPVPPAAGMAGRL